MWGKAKALGTRYGVYVGTAVVPWLCFHAGHGHGPIEWLIIVAVLLPLVLLGLWRPRKRASCSHEPDVHEHAPNNVSQSSETSSDSDS